MYSIGETVTFKVEGKEYTGSIAVVDPQGVDCSGNPTYDILVENTLYKHVREHMIQITPEELKRRYDLGEDHLEVSEDVAKFYLENIYEEGDVVSGFTDFVWNMFFN